MKKIFALLIVLLLLAIVSCTTKTPNPDSSDVQELTLQLCREHIQDQFLEVFAQNNTGMMPLVLETYGWPKLSYTEWKKHYQDNSTFKKTIDEVDAICDTMYLSLSGFRILSRNGEARKTEFQAMLNFADGTQTNIEATAQYSTDGYIYVSVLPFEPPR